MQSRILNSTTVFLHVKTDHKKIISDTNAFFTMIFIAVLCHFDCVQSWSYKCMMHDQLLWETTDCDISAEIINARFRLAILKKKI